MFDGLNYLIAIFIINFFFYNSNNDENWEPEISMRMRQGLLLLPRLLQPQKIKTQQPPTARHQNTQALPTQTRKTLLHTPAKTLQKPYFQLCRTELRGNRALETRRAV